MTEYGVSFFMDSRCIQFVENEMAVLSACTAGNLCLSPRVSTTAPSSDWLTYPRLTTFTTCLNASDVHDGRARHALLYDRYKRLSSSGSYDACFSTPSHSSCVVVDHSSVQSTCHESHDSTAPVPSHYERLQMNTGGSMDHQLFKIT